MASRLRRLRARALKAAFAAHTTIYELSDGRVGAGSSFPMLLLSVTGRKTGKTRTTPLVYFRDSDSYVVVGSDGAARRDPQWWKNLQANPQGRIRIGRDVFPLKPAKIIEYLDLRRPVYFETARHGHFGRDGDGFTWEKTHRADELRNLAGKATQTV